MRRELNFKQRVGNSCNAHMLASSTRTCVNLAASEGMKDEYWTALLRLRSIDTITGNFLDYSLLSTMEWQSKEACSQASSGDQHHCISSLGVATNIFILMVASQTGGLPSLYTKATTQNHIISRTISKSTYNTYHSCEGSPCTDDFHQH